MDFIARLISQVNIWHIIAIAIALSSAIFTGLLWRQQRTSMIHQVLMDVQKDYRSAEMQYAVRTLWDFYEQHGKDKLVEEYEKIRKEDEKWVSDQKKEKRAEFEKATLHYYRRLASHFYHHLAVLYTEKILPQDTFYSIWSESDLRIIPEILVPILNNLRTILHDPPLPPLDDSHALLVLYNDSKDP